MAKLRAGETYKVKALNGREVELSIYSPTEDIDGNPVQTLARKHSISVATAKQDVIAARKGLKMAEEIFAMIAPAVKELSATEDATRIAGEKKRIAREKERIAAEEKVLAEDQERLAKEVKGSDG